MNTRYVSCCLIAQLCLGMGAVLAAESVVWDFAAGDGAWQPRAKTVTVERATIVGPSGTNLTGLRIHGRIEVGWNYATSKPVPMAAGNLYRLSAWVRVDRLGAGTPMPYLKCEFQSADRNRDLGQASTDTYDAAPLGKWQRLCGEFRGGGRARNRWAGAAAPQLRTVRLRATARSPGARAQVPRPARDGSRARHATRGLAGGAGPAPRGRRDRAGSLAPRSPC